MFHPEEHLHLPPFQLNSHCQFFNANMPLPPFPAEYQWSADKLTACSASCGHRGLQLPQLRCLLDGNEVNTSYCAETPQPPLQPLACNRRDCPSRFVSPMYRYHACIHKVSCKGSLCGTSYHCSCSEEDMAKREFLSA